MRAARSDLEQRQSADGDGAGLDDRQAHRDRLAHIRVRHLPVYQAAVFEDEGQRQHTEGGNQRQVVLVATEECSLADHFEFQDTP
jgi:hypothetical protein